MANVHANQVTSGTIVTTTEFAVVSLTPVNVNNPAGEGVLLSGDVAVTPGAAATAITLRIRQGIGITGAVVAATPPLTVVAGNPIELGMACIDPTLLATGQSYTLTAQQTAATGNGTVGLAVITAESATSFE